MKLSINVPAINTSSEHEFENGDKLQSRFESEAGSIQLEYSVEEFAQLLTTNKEITVQILSLIRDFNCDKFVNMVKSLRK